MAVSRWMADTLITEVLGAFNKQQPGIDIRLTDSVVDGKFHKVHGAAVSFCIGPELPADPSITAQRLFDLPAVAVVSPQHALAQR